MLLKFLQRLLAFLAKGIIKKQKPLVIGITGSVGKSSAKQAINFVLKEKFNVRESNGNYNNEIGLPLTIIGKKSFGKNIFGWLLVFFIGFMKMFFKMKFYPKVLVLEMAADRPGDIGYLIKIAPCQIAVLTAISVSHTEFFNNIQGIIKEKQEIITHLLSDNWAILNQDDKNIASLKNKTQGKILTYGLSEKSDIRALEIAIEQEIKENRVEIRGLKFKISYQGSVVPVFLSNVISLAQVYSILAAVAVGISFEMNLLEIVQNFKSYELLPGRLAVLKGIKDTLILDDTYNSSPRALDFALETIKEIKIPLISRKWAVLGDMLELGSLSQISHFRAGEKVFLADLDFLITIGLEAKEIAKGALEKGMSNEKVFSFENSLGVIDFLKSRIKVGDLILVKGSQGMRMEKIVKEIMAKPNLAGKYLVRQSKKWLRF